MEGCGSSDTTHYPAAWLLSRHIYTYSRIQFFSHVSDRVLLAATRGEVGLAKVQDVISCLRTWNVARLSDCFKVSLLGLGAVEFQDGGVAKHLEAKSLTATTRRLNYNQYDWVVGALKWGLVSSRHIESKAFIILNVGQEGWCVVTSDYHTMVHVLRKHNMKADYLTSQEVCGKECEHRQDELWPFSRAPLQARSSNVLLPYYETSNRAQPTTPFVRNLCEDVLQVTEGRLFFYLALPSPGLLTYLNHKTFPLSAPQVGIEEWFFVAGFDPDSQVHLAVGFCSHSNSVVELMRPTSDTFEFLKDIRPLIRKTEREKVHRFIRSFTELNGLKWDEAVCELFGMQSLQSMAFEHVVHMPLTYLEQNLPPIFYRKVESSPYATKLKIRLNPLW